MAGSVTLKEIGMPTTFQVACREYGHDYLALLQEAGQVMVLGMRGGRDPVNGRHHTAASPTDLLVSIVYSVMQRCGGLKDGLLLHPMEETERRGKGVTRRDRLLDILHDFLDNTGHDLKTGEGVCFCLDAAWSGRQVERTLDRIEALLAEEGK